MRYTQPQGPNRVSWENPSTRGSYLLVAGHTSINVVTGRPPDLQLGLKALGVGIYGVFNSVYTGNSTGIRDDQYSIPSTTDFALLAQVDHSTSGGLLAVILGGDGAGNRQFQLRFTASNTVEFIRFNTASEYVSCSVAAGSRRGTVLAVSVGNSITVYFGGKSASATISGTPQPLTKISIGAGFGFDGYAYQDDKLFMAAVLCGSSVSPTTLLANPWQIFADDKKPIFIGVGAAPSGLSITVDLATASASGYAATVNRQSVISSTLATATASGFTANVGTGNAITATLATATASGQTATINQQSNITSTHATASASGHTATVNRQLAFAATLATATASGQTATVNIQRSVAATQAAATATGYTANVQLGNDLSISATQAAATASGFDAAINRQLSIAATLATATASGFDASISNGASIAASYGLASADGYQAQVNLQREIAASLATASASGFTAAISTSTGTAVWPTPDQVLSGITYGPTGADYTGTATAGGYPTAADIAAAVRADLTAELARIDAAISSRATVAAIMGATAP